MWWAALAFSLQRCDEGVLFRCKGSCDAAAVAVQPREPHEPHEPHDPRNPHELRTSSPGFRAEKSSLPGRGRAERVAWVADQQWGAIDTLQLHDCGLSDSAVSRWALSGRLHRRYPGVYTVGHRSIPVEGELTAALLAAGREAVLSHATAAWWWELIADRPPIIEISVPQACRPHVEGIVIHRPRRLERTHHRRLPITPPARALVDFAARASVTYVKRALAEAEYLDVLNLETASAAAATRGRPGTATLRKAIAGYQPELARTRSKLEVGFHEFCQRAHIPTPRVNVMLHGCLVDAFWPAQRVVVELDGYEGHRTAAQLARDHARDLKLRAHGYRVLRYSHDQVKHQPREVAADLLRELYQR